MVLLFLIFFSMIPAIVDSTDESDEHLLVKNYSQNVQLSNLTRINIINGHINSSPKLFFVRLSVMDENPVRVLYYCGGAIVANYWVITAAQCVAGTSEDKVLIVAKDWHRAQPTFETYPVSSISIAPGYDDRIQPPMMDIALLRTSRKFAHTSIIQLCDLHFTTETAMGSCGLGTTTLDSNKPSSLLTETFYRESIYADKSIFNPKMCRFDNICTYGEPGSQLSFHDEGNPLYMLQCGTSQPTCLYGVASFFKDGENYFSRIQTVIPWVLSAITA